MPDISAQLVPGLPVVLRDTIRNLIGRIVLIAAHDLQNAICIVRYRVKSDQLVRHRNRQQGRSNHLPVTNRIIIEIRPMKEKVRIELPVRARIGKIQRFLRIHCHKNLNQRKQPREYALMRILLNLIAGLRYRHSGFLQFNMKDRHPVNQQHQITAPILQNLVVSWKQRLLCNLVAALASCNLQTVIDLQTDLLAVMKLVLRILPNDRNRLPIDKTIQRQRRAKAADLLQQLLHLLRNQRAVIQPVNVTIVLEQNIRPVLNQILLGRMMKDLFRPAIALQSQYQFLFKIRFFIKSDHNCSLYSV